MLAISPLNPLDPDDLGASVGGADADQRTVALAFTKEGVGIIAKMIKQTMKQLVSTVKVKGVEINVRFVLLGVNPEHAWV